MDNIEIRRPKIDELELIHKFFASVISSTYQKEGLSKLQEELVEEIQFKKAYLDEDFLTNGEKRYFLFAYKNNAIIGSIGYGEPSSIIVEESNGQMSHLLEVGSMLVDPDYQHQGIGNKLLQAIMQTFKDKGITEFCFDSGYKQAQSIWTKKFGPPTMFLEDYWGVNSHHMIWRKSISEVL